MYELQSCYQRMLHVCKKLNQFFKCGEYVGKLWVISTIIRDHYCTLDGAHVNENSSLKTINLESIKTTINECIAINVL